MDILATLIDSAWSGLFAGSLGVILTAPLRYILPTFVCGFTARLVRNILAAAGLGLGWATAAAAAAVVLAATALLRRHEDPPVVLISAVLPLGPSMSMFNATLDLMKAASAPAEDLNGVSAALTAELGRVFTQALAIALGLALGMAIVRLLRGEDLWEKA